MLKLTLITFLPLIAGCSIFDPLVRYQVGSARHNYEAASPHVSMVALFPWDDIWRKLKPKFKLNGEKALELSRSLNALYDERVSRAYNLQIALQILSALPPSKDQNSQGAQGAAAAPPGGQAAPGAVPAPPSIKAAPPVDNTSLLEAMTALAGKQSSINIESGLNYRLAAGLFDLVMILNESIKYVPRINGYDQYLLVTQVSVIPRKRNLPFDVYTDLAFFPGPGEIASPPAYLTFSGNTAIQDPAPLPEVFTLLPTNTMELAQEQRTRRLAADLSLSGGGTIGSVGLSGSGGTSQEQRDQAQALDYNGIFSAERIATNVVRAAVGARQTAGGDYEMIASSSLVATYILIPNWYRQLDVYTEQTLVNPLSGKPLGRGVPASIYDSDLNDLIENHNLGWNRAGGDDCKIDKVNSHDSPENAIVFFKKKLNDLVLRGEYERFVRLVRTCLRTPKKPMPREEYQPLWLDAARIVANLPRSFFRVNIKP